MSISAQSSIKRYPIEAVLTPFSRFAKMEAAGGIVLLASTIAALLWANSPWEHSYHALLEEKFTIGFGHFLLSVTRHEWIDDGLMSIFFFLVGLEIKREVLIGELSSLKQAMFPLLAAIGGTVVPAVIYFAINSNGPGQKGWGIPMATDIAFALGVLALLGGRVPVALKVFVTALAIVDDIIAVLVIALFYTEQIHVLSLAIGLAGLAFSFICNLLGVRKPAVYAIIGVFVWFAVLQSGIHATVAGVLLAFTIPARTYIDREQFLQHGRQLLNKFEAAQPGSAGAHAAIHALEKQCALIESPLHRLEYILQPWVSFLVMPLFAFANAGVHVLGKIMMALTHPVTLGVVFGLIVGKPVGISLFAWISVRTKLAKAPSGVSWTQTFGASCLCGLGFTMSLFIGALAFKDIVLLDMSKIGILFASVTAAIVGAFILQRSARQYPAEPQMPAEV